MIQEILLKTRELNIGYQGPKGERTIAAGLDLEVFRGELICLVGPNGVGKSTLLRTLAGLHNPLKGNVLLKGEELTSHSPIELAKILGLVLTDRIEMEGFNIFDIVALGRFPYMDWKGSLCEEDRRIITGSLQMVQGESLEGRKLSELSDGERQKVMIARALAQEPELILLDEPTSFLDLLRKVEVVQIMKELTRKNNKAVVMALHDIPLALQYADRLWLMEPSGILHHGAPEDLVLSGRVVETFSSDSLVFDPVTGSYPFKGRSDKKIVLNAEGMNELWTRKALAREGYSMVGEDQDTSGIPVLIVKEDNNCLEWHLMTEGREESYSSIYDLVKRLRSTFTGSQA